MRIEYKHFLYNLSTIKKLLFEMLNLYRYLKNEKKS